MLAGALVYALAAFGYLADFLARESLMQATIGGQVVLLNYALVQRWRLLNEKLLQMEHQARTELEFKVHERTAQLRSTMHELERANRKLAALSLNDALTGLHNRRHMDAALPELCAESRRTGQPLSLALIDADRFKAINDTWGHAFGDVCLQRIAEVLQRHAKRPRDVAIRFGGEEFALLLPGTDAQGARQLCRTHPGRPPTLGCGHSGPGRSDPDHERGRCAAGAWRGPRVPVSARRRGAVPGQEQRPRPGLRRGPGAQRLIRPCRSRKSRV